MHIPIRGFLIAVLALVGPWGTDAAAQAGKAQTVPAKSGTKTIFGIDWHPSMTSAAAAAAKNKSPRPLFVLRVLGDLEGFT